MLGDNMNGSNKMDYDAIKNHASEVSFIYGNVSKYVIK